MSDKKSTGGRFIASLALFVLTTVTAFVLILTAFLLWLSYLIGSFIAAALITGCFFGILALIFYLFALRSSIEEIQAKFQTVYDVAHIVKTGYDWVNDKIQLFLGVRDTMRER